MAEHKVSSADSQYQTFLVDRYQIAETDEPTGGPNYYGFVDISGQWYLMKETISGDTKSYRFCRGLTDFPTAWTNRALATPTGATSSYDYFNISFNA